MALSWVGRWDKSMSLWRRITASASLEGEQYVVVYAGNTATTDEDLNLIAYPFNSATGFGDRIEPTQFIEDGFNGPGRVKFSPGGAEIATTAELFIPAEGDFGLVSYDWDAGFGSRTTSGVKPRGGQAVVFHPDGDVVLVSHAENSSTSRIYAYNWSDTTGYGSTRATSGTVSNSSQSWMPIALSPNSEFVALGYTESVNLAIFPFSKSTGFGAKVEPPSDPLTGVDGGVRGVAWNNAGTYIALACNSPNPAERLSIYEWDNATGTLGAKVSGITIEGSLTSASVGCYSVIFAPDDSAVIVSVAVAGRQLQAYAWDNSTGTFGSQYSLPTTTGGTPTELKFNTNGDVIFASGGDASSAPVVAYQWDSASGFGTKYDDPDNTGLGGGYNAYSIDYKDFG